MLVSGGTSVGQEDHAPRLLAELGELDFHGISMRPSSPTGIGRIDDRFVFLLPGNPVSCLAAYEFFAGPTIRALGGRTRAWPHRRVACRSRARSPPKSGAPTTCGSRSKTGMRSRSRPRVLRFFLRRCAPRARHRAARARGHARGRRGRGAALRRGADGSSRRPAEADAVVKQQQFLEVLDRDEAERRWRAVDRSRRARTSDPARGARPRAGRGRSRRGRRARVRSLEHGRLRGPAADTFGASEEEPIRLELNDEISRRASSPQIEVAPDARR